MFGPAVYGAGAAAAHRAAANGSLSGNCRRGRRGRAAAGAPFHAEEPLAAAGRGPAAARSDGRPAPARPAACAAVARHPGRRGPATVPAAGRSGAPAGLAGVPRPGRAARDRSAHRATRQPRPARRPGPAKPASRRPARSRPARRRPAQTPAARIELADAQLGQSGPGEPAGGQPDGHPTGSAGASRIVVSLASPVQGSLLPVSRGSRTSGRRSRCGWLPRPGRWRLLRLRPGPSPLRRCRPSPCLLRRRRMPDRPQRPAWLRPLWLLRPPGPAVASDRADDVTVAPAAEPVAAAETSPDWPRPRRPRPCRPRRRPQSSRLSRRRPGRR